MPSHASTALPTVGNPPPPPRTGALARGVPTASRATEHRLRLLAPGARREPRVPAQGELAVAVRARPPSGAILNEKLFVPPGETRTLNPVSRSSQMT